MPKYQKILVWLFVVLTLLLLGVYLFIQIKGRTLLQEKLSAALNREVRITDVRFILPFGLRVGGLHIEDLLYAKEIRVQLAAPLKLKEEYILSHVVVSEPVFVLERDKEFKVFIREFMSEKIGAKDSVKGKSKKKNASDEVERREILDGISTLPSMIIDSLEVNNGRVKIIDHSSTQELEFTLTDIDLKARTFAYPLKSVKTKYVFSAAILEQDVSFGGCRVESGGWVNFMDRDMDSTLKIIESNGVEDLNATLKSEKNDLTVIGKINVKSLASNKKKEEERKGFSFDDMILGALQSSGIKIDVDFAIKTKMDNFQLSSISFSGKLEYGGADGSSGSLKEDLKSLGKQFYEENMKTDEQQAEQQQAEPVKQTK